MVSEENPRQAVSNAEVKEREGRGSPGRANESCLCGHRASSHTANRYACQAAGDRKGYCPCMRFVARNSPIGKRLRAVGRAKPGTGMMA
jgi:hypothetical protein